MPRPSFLVIGAMKCGTSTVCAYLEDHPQVFMLPRAEPNFFAHDAIWDQGVAGYEALFDAATGQERHVGEGSNDYTNGARYPQAAARMAGYNPGLKLIYIVRDPVKRMRSDWIQRRSNDPHNMPQDLEQALHDKADILVDQSLYWTNLQLYRAQFPDAQIHLAFLEDLHRDPAGFFEALTDFLGLARHAPDRPHVNPSAAKEIPNAAYDRVTGIGGYKMLKRLIPQGLRAQIKSRFFTTPATRITATDVPTPDDVAARLRADAARFLAHAGKPADFWTFGA